tara:strand:+ start:219 stop:524 length:306 start_codon:yes stop_codon:yes gene_type:complete
MYKPLPNCLTIKESKIHGLGLFAAKDIPPNIDLGITHVPDERFEDGYIRTPLGGFFNHSKKPNCTVVDKENCLRLITSVEIKTDTELTAYYTLYKVTLEKR